MLFAVFTARKEPVRNMGGFKEELDVYRNKENVAAEAQMEAQKKATGGAFGKMAQSCQTMAGQMLMANEIGSHVGNETKEVVEDADRAVENRKEDVKARYAEFKDQMKDVDANKGRALAERIASQMNI
jgi:hypothetical protein